MALNGSDGWKWLEMTRNGWKWKEWLEMAGHGRNG